MKSRRLITWPFLAFLFGYGAPNSDPTVASLGDQVLSSAAVGLGLALVVGLPLALIFRRGDRELGRGAMLEMAIALTGTVVLDPAGFGLFGPALYFWWMRGSGAKKSTVGQETKP